MQMHKILKVTLHKQCSCPEVKQCFRCIKIKDLKSWKHRSRSPNKIKSNRKNKLPQWYNRRKSLNNLKSLHNREKQTENKRKVKLEGKKREKEALEYLKRRKSDFLPPVKYEKKVEHRRQSISPSTQQKLRPQVFMEEPHRLPVPLVLNHYREQSTAVQYFDRQSRWKSRYKLPEQKTSVLQQRYKRQMTSNEPKAYNKEDKINEKNVVEQGRVEREFEVYDVLRHKAESLPPPKIKKKIHVKRRSASVKPMSTSRYASVKIANRNESLGHRFMNCFYRACCRCYCYLTCVFLIVFLLYVLYKPL